MPRSASTPNSKLSVTSYVTLGMIALRGPSTSYDLKRAIGKSVGYFWPFPHAQLYDEPVRLTSLGLLAHEQERRGRRRRVYRITQAGKEALRSWLRGPTTQLMEFRDVAQLKLFFGELGETQDLIALAQAQIERHKARLEHFQNIAQKHANHRALAIRMAPLDIGIRIERAVLSFWEETGKRPPKVRK
jgi:PadR family transcriptional regulator, regulatory protein AphA